MSNKYKFKTKLKLQNAINLWTSNKNSAKKKYGNINNLYFLKQLIIQKIQ